MSETKKENPVVEVEFLTSLAMAVPVNGTVKHVQITLVLEKDSGEIKCYFDVVDPTKVKLEEIKDE